jgi:AraC-like DNA-binding protein
VFRAVRLTGAIFFSIDASDPWIAETPPGTELAPHLVPGAEHVIDYHVITTGTCWGGLLDGPPVRLEAGDLIVFPQGDPHVLSSAPGMRDAPDIGRYRGARELPLPISLSMHGGGRESAGFICGFLGCDSEPFNPLLASLPRMIHWRSGETNSTLRALMDLALLESRSRRAGSESVLSRLSELLFVEVVRGYLSTLPTESTGWLAGLRDESVGRALQKLHERPTHAWTLKELAKMVGVSRSLLAARFAHLVGTPPMQYLSEWRIQLAASELRTTQASLAEIAARVGYGSEAALSRAFKRSLGISPTQYRRGDARVGKPDMDAGT